jgi:LmbE family N-acetylglucosaminyl deacetylase
MKLDNLSVLLLAPHTDDVELAAGGTVAKLIKSNCTVDYVAFSACEESVPIGFEKDILRTESLAATEKLGINPANVNVLDFKVRHFPRDRQKVLDELIQIRRKKHYDLVLTPSTEDFHQDHKVISEESIRAFKNTSILGYELPWNHLSTKNTLFIQLQPEDLERKIDALKMYKSQYGRNYCSEEYIRALALVKGAHVGVEFAESYEVIRWVID